MRNRSWSSLHWVCYLKYNNLLYSAKVPDTISSGMNSTMLGLALYVLGDLGGFVMRVMMNAPMKAMPRFGVTAKTFRTEVQLHGPNTPIIHDNVSSTYVKGANGVGFYCVRQPDGSTVKYPMNGIYRVVERDNPAEQGE
jgi:hypothetical protein